MESQTVVPTIQSSLSSRPFPINQPILNSSKTYRESSMPAQLQSAPIIHQLNQPISPMQNPTSLSFPPGSNGPPSNMTSISNQQHMPFTQHHQQQNPSPAPQSHLKNALQQPPQPSPAIHQQQPLPPQQQQQQQQQQPLSAFQKLENESVECWLSLGRLAEIMGEYDRAMSSYEAALRHNRFSISTLTAIANFYRSRELFPKAIEYFQFVLDLAPGSGEIWGLIGHCYLMLDDLEKAYRAYQQALRYLPDPKDAKLWYGIGILYERSDSLGYAKDAFQQVLKMDPNFEKANETSFRLGIIYKQQTSYQEALDCFRRILNNPPHPLTEVDILFQIGHVYEQQKEYQLAKEAYERVLQQNPNHAKVLQQLGWLYHQPHAPFSSQDLAIECLEKSLEADSKDAQSWYLLGRCYMAQQKYNKAYEAYQQAVYRDEKNPKFWCSIGVLYYQINQYRDALEAYFRAIRINPTISEVWYDLGTLYESCNNQISDAFDAYQHALELDPENPHIRARLEQLRNSQNNQGSGGPPPRPQDINPISYPHHQPGPSHDFWDTHKAQEQPSQQIHEPEGQKDQPWAAQQGFQAREHTEKDQQVHEEHARAETKALDQQGNPDTQRDTFKQEAKPREENTNFDKERNQSTANESNANDDKNKSAAPNGSDETKILPSISGSLELPPRPNFTTGAQMPSLRSIANSNPSSPLPKIGDIKDAKSQSISSLLSPDKTSRDENNTVNGRHSVLSLLDMTSGNGTEKSVSSPRISLSSLVDNENQTEPVSKIHQAATGSVTSQPGTPKEPYTTPSAEPNEKESPKLNSGVKRSGNWEEENEKKRIASKLDGAPSGLSPNKQGEKMSSKSPTEEHAAKPAVDTGSPSTQDTDMSNVQTTETSSKQEEKDKSVSTVDTSKESNGTKAGSLGAPSSPEPAKRRDSDVNMEEPVEAPQRQIEEDSDYDQDEKAESDESKPQDDKPETDKDGDVDMDQESKN